MAPIEEEEEERSNGSSKVKYFGVRRRKWGKWVSEIRLPCSETRLWLGSYSTPEAAAVAHDTAVFYLRGSSSSSSSSSRQKLNFPCCVPPIYLQSNNMSPQLIQRAASDAGMAVDAELAARLPICCDVVVGELPKSTVFQGLKNSIWYEEGDDHTMIDYAGRTELREGEEDLSISIDDMEICM